MKKVQVEGIVSGKKGQREHSDPSERIDARGESVVEAGVQERARESVRADRSNSQLGNHSACRMVPLAS